MKPNTVALFAKLFLLLNVVCSVLGEIGCPPPEDIAPCTCRHRPSTYLECKGVKLIPDLQRVFENSERYTYQEVHIESAILSYLPQELFERTTVNELYIENSNFVSLFKSPPESNSLYKLHLNNTHFQRSFQTEILTSLNKLRILSVSGCLLATIRSNFSSHLPKSLKEIELIGMRTKKIEKDAFSDLVNLDKIVINSNKLNGISRDVFPQPFNARFIYLDNNNLNKIPQDLFTDMPNLQFLSLKNNNLSEVPQVAFQGRTRSVPYVRLDGNPLKCNCLLVWLIRDKPQIIGGTCTSPTNLHGRNLQDLRPGDFNC